MTKNVSCLFKKDEKGTVEKKSVFCPEKDKKLTTAEVYKVVPYNAVYKVVWQSCVETHVGN